MSHQFITLRDQEDHSQDHGKIQFHLFPNQLNSQFLFLVMKKLMVWYMSHGEVHPLSLTYMGKFYLFLFALVDLILLS